MLRRPRVRVTMRDRAFEFSQALWTRLRSESERASYRVAERYRRDGDALGFVCETHQELPAQPPPGRRTLILFAHFDLQGVVAPYVVYYLKALHGLGATIIFVSGSPTLTPESVAPIRELCAGIYTRHTLSLDFGSWHLGWWILRGRGGSLDQFDRFFTAHHSVYGRCAPFPRLRNVRSHRKYRAAGLPPPALLSGLGSQLAHPPLPQRPVE